MSTRACPPMSPSKPCQSVCHGRGKVVFPVQAHASVTSCARQNLWNNRCRCSHVWPYAITRSNPISWRLRDWVSAFHKCPPGWFCPQQHGSLQEPHCYVQRQFRKGPRSICQVRLMALSERATQELRTLLRDADARNKDSKKPKMPYTPVGSSKKWWYSLGVAHKNTKTDLF